MSQWNIYGKVETGKTFLGNKEKCEDKFNYLVEKDSFCVAVSDGAGSYKYSEIGADVASKTICKVLKKNFDEFYLGTPIKVKQQIIKTIRQNLSKIAARKQSTLKEFSSTLLFVAVKDNKILAGHIGDGLIAIKRPGKFLILSEPENGEESNETFFVTSKNYLQHLRIYKGEIENIQSFILMTDGSSHSYYHRKKNILNKQFADEIGNLLKMEQNQIQGQLDCLMTQKISKRTLDDCCLVIIDKNPAHISFE